MRYINSLLLTYLLTYLQAPQYGILATPLLGEWLFSKNCLELKISPVGEIKLINSHKQSCDELMTVLITRYNTSTTQNQQTDRMHSGVSIC